MAGFRLCREHLALFGLARRLPAAPSIWPGHIAPRAGVLSYPHDLRDTLDMSLNSCPWSCYVSLDMWEGRLCGCSVILAPFAL